MYPPQAVRPRVLQRHHTRSETREKPTPSGFAYHVSTTVGARRKDAPQCDPGGTTDTFAHWACAWAQATNSSLAGSRVLVDAQDLARGGGALALRMAEWGLVPTHDAAQADFIYPDLPKRQDLTAADAWARAERGMPVSAELARRIAAEGLLRGVHIALSLIVEPKTAVLVERLAAAGATVGVYCHAHECDQAIANQIRARGYAIEADATWTPAQEREGSLRLMDRIRPDVVIDDGGNFSRLMVMERPTLAARLVGVAEETTSGVRAFTAMQQEGELPFPVVAVNDSRLKTGFDNRHGTGETCAATTMSLVGPSFFSAAGGARVTVVGFGPVGEGFARRVRALGARVTVAEADPVRALEASFAGFAVAPLDSALPATDMAVSATGVRHTLPADALRLLPDGATVAVIGGIANEVALDQVLSQGGTLRPGEKTGVSWLDVPQGPTLRLLASGDGVNYAAGPGNPIEIMDLSFAVQLAAVEHLLRHAGSLPAEVLRLGPEVDRRIASIALEARGIRTESAPSTPTFVPDWRVTRYADTAGTTPQSSSGSASSSSDATTSPSDVAWGSTPAPTDRKKHA